MNNVIKILMNTLQSLGFQVIRQNNTNVIEILNSNNQIVKVLYLKNSNSNDSAWWGPNETIINTLSLNGNAELILTSNKNAYLLDNIGINEIKLKFIITSNNQYLITEEQLVKKITKGIIKL